MSAITIKSKTCQKCQQKYILDIGGNADGCTKCMKLDTDNTGRLWRKDQLFQIIQNGSENVTVLHRWEAFKNGGKK